MLAHIRRSGTLARAKHEVINGCINTGVIITADFPGSLKAKTYVTCAKHAVGAALQMAGEEKAAFRGCSIFVRAYTTVKTYTAQRYSCTSTETHKQLIEINRASLSKQTTISELSGSCLRGENAREQNTHETRK